MSDKKPVFLSARQEFTAVTLGIMAAIGVFEAAQVGEEEINPENWGFWAAAGFGLYMGRKTWKLSRMGMMYQNMSDMAGEAEMPPMPASPAKLENR